METNSVVLTTDSERFKVHVIENGVTTERQFRVRAFAASWAEGQSLRLGVHVVHEGSSPKDPRVPVPLNCLSRP
ncbi:protein of unknown function [Pseudorhizobium banfieldiae]|uniref:Uncharacterized protein n=1 Tax=Pseudorhizobium banfieldiae TaxID=1125847 RepID=L0NHQ7_9HYPH|nr:hypothetical protein RNT25_03020 [arsenite-oxidising bacterium NT-25]CCF20404.1 protein of unknown function [Pseudorhizobium banfieldiae]